MNMKRWWPYLAIGSAAVIVSVAYPMYFKWWDHKSCHESGDEWSSTQHQCIEPRNAHIPDTQPSENDRDGKGGAD